MCPGLGGGGTVPTPSPQAVLINWRSLCIKARVCNVFPALTATGQLACTPRRHPIYWVVGEILRIAENKRDFLLAW